MFEELLSILEKNRLKHSSLLTEVKKWFTNRKIRIEDIQDLNENDTLCREILEKAARQQSAEVLSFLIQKGFDPSIATQPFGFNLLHYVTLNGLAGMAQVILDQKPDLIDKQSREGATALFLAVQQENVPLVKLFLQRGASPNQYDLGGLSPVGMAIIKQNPDILSLLLQKTGSSPILFDTLNSQTNLFISMLNIPHPHKMRCLNLLFAAGAGLELSHIPDNVLTIYGISRDQLKDFLILGQEKQPDGSFKKKFLTTILQLTNALQDPNWKLEQDQLAKVCLHPLLQDSPVVKAVKSLLSTEAILCLPTIPSPPSRKVEPIEFISQISEISLIQRINDEMTILSNSLRNINNVMSDEIISSRLIPLVHCVMQSTHALSALWHHPKMPTDVSDNLLQKFGLLIKLLTPIIKAHKAFDSLALYHVLDKHLKSILKLHGDVLKEKHTSLFNSFIDAKALVDGKMSRLYLNRGEFDVAINLSLEAIAINDLLVINHPMLELTAKYNKALSLVNCSEVYISQGWFKKAARHTSHALVLLLDSCIYDDFVIKQVQHFAELFAAHHNAGRSLALIKQAITYLERVFPGNDEQVSATADYIVKLNQQHATLLSNAFGERIALVKQQLNTTCAIVADEDNHSIYLTPKFEIFSEQIQETYFAFLENNKGFKLLSGGNIEINQETLLSKNFAVKLAEFAKILAPNPIHAFDLIAPLASLQLDEKEETFGFIKPVGFTRIMPIESPSLPKNTLFITMPEDSEAFMPFYKLIRNQDKSTYYPISSINPKGVNQHGVKLGTTSIKGSNHASTKVAYGRLKAGGTLRARGLVEQTVTNEDAKQCKLYVFREVEPKKQEQRKNYKW